jgi:hypothetical protein
MFTYSNSTFREPENQATSGQRFRKFLKTQPVLTLLIAQAILLYIFLSAGLFYALIMVTMLYFGGLFLRQFHSDLLLLAAYLTGAATGFLLYPLMFPGTTAMFSTLHLAAIQGSAVMALLAFPAVSQPSLKMRVFLLIFVKFRHIAFLLMIIVLLSRDLSGGGTHLCYLGGAATSALLAWIIVWKMKGLPLGKIRGLFHPRQKQRFMKYETINEQGNRPMTDEDYNDIRADRQKKVDEILEKISRSGYDSLTKAEKELLFKQSKP